MNTTYLDAWDTQPPPKGKRTMFLSAGIFCVVMLIASIIKGRRDRTS